MDALGQDVSNEAFLDFFLEEDEVDRLISIPLSKWFDDGVRNVGASTSSVNMTEENLNGLIYLEFIRVR